MTKDKAAELPASKKLFRQLFIVFRSNWRLIGAVTLIYGLAYFVFSNGISSVDISALRARIEETVGISSGSAGGRLLLASGVLQAAGSLSEAGAAYMFFVSMVTILALIWIMRHHWTKKKTTLRDAYYKGMYPVVPLVLTMSRALLQLLPLLAGAFILATGIGKDIFISSTEIITASLVLLIVPALWSGYLLTNTVFALIIVTIPDMRPTAAYKEAKSLVKGRRAYIVKNFILAAVLWFLAAILVLLPVVALVPVLAPLVGLVLSITVLPLSTTFLYTTYRGLL